MMDEPPKVTGRGPLGSNPPETIEATPLQNPEEAVTKVCPKCSVQNQTIGKFCPNCGAAYDAHRVLAKVNKRAVLIIAAALIVIIAGIGVVLNIQHTNQVNAEQAAAAAAFEAEKKREADAAEAAAKATASKQAADDVNPVQLGYGSNAPRIAWRADRSSRSVGAP
jgi:uncharacterized protein HemX